MELLDTIHTQTQIQTSYPNNTCGNKLHGYSSGTLSLHFALFFICPNTELNFFDRPAPHLAIVCN